MSDHLKRLRGVAHDGRNWGRVQERKDIAALIADYDEMREALRLVASVVNGEEKSAGGVADAYSAMGAVLAKAGGK